MDGNEEELKLSHRCAAYLKNESVKVRVKVWASKRKKERKKERKFTE